MLNDIEIGETTDGETVWLDAEARKRNVLVIGPPGSGKTKFLEDQVRQHIRNGEGLFLLDPDGSVYDPIVEWCARHRLHRHRSIHLIDLREEQWSVGFDGFRTGSLPAGISAELVDAVLVARIDAVVAGFAQVFSGEDTHRTPLLRKCLRSACYALAVNGLTLAEMTMLTTATDVHGLREVLTSNLPNEAFRSVWADFNALSRREFTEQFGSTMNRIIEFISSPLVRRMLAQRKHVIDFRRAMDQGEIILCRAASDERVGLSPEAARLIGTLLMGELVVCGLGRDEAAGQRRPFNVVIDEAPQYLNSDIELALDRLRKRGVHLTFAIQRLGQLRAAGENIYNAIMQDAQTKIIFRQNNDADAQILALELFRPEFDLNQVKLTAPATVGHYIEVLTGESVIESEGGADIKARSQSEGEAQADNWGRMSFEGQGDQMQWDGSFPIGLPQGIGQSNNEGSGATKGGSRARQRQSATSEAQAASWGRATARNEHQVLAPQIEWIPTQLKNLEEVTHEHIVKLRRLPDRFAVVKTMDQPTILIRTLDVEPAFASPQFRLGVVREILEGSAYTSPLTAIEQEIAERRERLAYLAGTADTPETVSEGPKLKDPVWG